MNATQWLCFSAAVGVMFAVAVLDWRYEDRKRRRINVALADTRCKACGGILAELHGERSRNHYVFTDGSRVEDVIDLVCTACGEHSDAFWTLDGELNIQMPW